MRNPNLNGFGQGWIIPLPEVRSDGKPHATIHRWLIKGPFHPFWNTWVMDMSHLRDLPGLDPAKKDHPDNTHEFTIVSLNPGKDGNNVYDPDHLPYPLPWMRPIDCCVQFKCGSDVEAAELLDGIAKMICVLGEGSPDSDYASFWKQMIEGTIACGKHTEKKLQ